MSFICYAGGSKHTHERAAEGRECYAKAGYLPPETPEEVAAHYVAVRAGLAKVAAGSTVPMFAAPRVDNRTTTQYYHDTTSLKDIEDLVPAGHYAVIDPEDNRLKCYRVDKGTGRWEGYTFLKVAQSDEWWNCKAREYRLRILREILKDVDAAGKKYAETMTRCRRCNRAIHDQDNPYYSEGYGPECGAKI